MILSLFLQIPKRVSFLFDNNDLKSNSINSTQLDNPPSDHFHSLPLTIHHSLHVQMNAPTNKTNSLSNDKDSFQPETLENSESDHESENIPPVSFHNSFLTRITDASELFPSKKLVISTKKSSVQNVFNPSNPRSNSAKISKQSQSMNIPNPKQPDKSAKPNLSQKRNTLSKRKSQRDINSKSLISSKQYVGSHSLTSFDENDSFSIPTEISLNSTTQSQDSPISTTQNKDPPISTMHNKDPPILAMQNKNPPISTMHNKDPSISTTQNGYNSSKNSQTDVKENSKKHVQFQSNPLSRMKSENDIDLAYRLKANDSNRNSLSSLDQMNSLPPNSKILNSDGNFPLNDSTKDTALFSSDNSRNYIVNNPPPKSEAPESIVHDKTFQSEIKKTFDGFFIILKRILSQFKQTIKRKNFKT